MTLDRRIDSFVSPAADVPTDLPPDPMETLAADPVADESVQVAGLTSGLGTGVKAVKDALAPLLKKGAKSALPEDVKVIPPDVPPVAPPAAPAPVKPAEIPAPVIKAVPLDKMEAIGKARGEAIAKDAAGIEKAAGKPPERAFNTEVYDDVGLQATVNAVADSAGVDYAKMSVRSIYQQALAQGIPEGQVAKMLQGIPLNSKVGDNGLALNTARVLTVFDESGKRLDDLFTKLSAGELDDAGKLDLRRQLAIHESISRSVKGYQVDIARSMNVFKRVKDAGPTLDAKAARLALDELGGDNVLLKLAEDYLASPTRAGKNALIEKGAGAKMREAWFYTFQSNLLNDVSTHAVNLAGNAVFGVLQPVERLLATAIGKGRTLMPGADPARYTMEDNYAVWHGFMNMMADGFQLASASLKRDVSTGLKADQVAPVNPLTSEYWSDTPLNVFGKEVWRTPDLRDSVAGKLLDGLATLQSIPFRALSTVDEFFGGVASRWQLHSEAWTFANKEYDRLIAAGVSEADAKAEIGRQVGQLLTDRPQEMQASLEGFRKMVTFQRDLAAYREVPTGEFYWRAAEVFQNPLLKVLQPFVRTVTNIWIEGTARTPGLNFISPRFYDDFNAGGKQRDLAVARLAMGGGLMTTMAGLALENRVTGYGPSQNEDRQALERTGWMPYSFVFDKGELSARNLERLSKITKVSTGDDKIYISFARFEPLSIIAATGADAADAAKFNRGGEWDDDAENMVKTGAFVASNYVTNLPLMQGIGDLIKIGRSRSEDGGEKFLQIMDGIAKQYGNFLITGSPVVGLANSSLMAHVERVFNPTRSNTMPDTADVPYGVRAFYENLQRVRSRIPGLSEGVPPALDSLGRPLEAVTAKDHWANWMPWMTARQGKRSEVDEMLISLDFGIHEPPKRMDGVALSATQFNRYKQLYGQEIRLDGMNLEQFLPTFLKRAEEDASQAGEVLTTGDKQKLIMGVVEKYRSLAKLRMIGDAEGSPVPGEELGLPGDTIEFDDLRKLIERNKLRGSIYGR